MQAASSSSSSTITRKVDTTTQELRLAELRDRLGHIVAATVQKISRVFAENVDNAKENLTALDGGIWYASNYYRCLKAFAKRNPVAQQKLNDLRERDYFYHPIPPQCFKLVPSTTSPSGFEIYLIEILEAASPSEALDALVNDCVLGLLDCASVCEIGLYRALQEVLGQDKFDKLFHAKNGAPLRIGRATDLANPIFHFLKRNTHVGKNKGFREIKVGEWIGFKGVDEYHRKHHLMGEAGAFNVICLNDKPGEQTFVGLGLDPNGVNEDGVEEALIQARNEPPLSSEALSERVKSEKEKGGLFPLNQELHHTNSKIYDAACHFLTETSPGNRRALKALYEAEQYPSQAIQANLKLLVRLAEPLAREDIQDPHFGFNDGKVLELNVEVIDALVRTPLQLISIDFVKRLGSRYK